MRILKPNVYLIVGDVHLHPQHPQMGELTIVIDEALSRLKKGERITLVFNGDLFDFILIPGGSITPLPVIEALDELDSNCPEFFDALANIIIAKGDVVFIAGNHDQELFSRLVQEKIKRLILKRKLKPQLLTRIQFPLWFYRPRNVVHIEHGSQYDSDNAVLHPLLIEESSQSASIYPLGVLLGKHLQKTLGEDLNDLTLRVEQDGVKSLAWLIKRYKWGMVRMLWHFIRGAEKIIKLSRDYKYPSSDYIRDKEALYAAEQKLPINTVKVIASYTLAPTMTDPIKTRERLFLNRLYIVLILIFMIPSWFLAPLLMGPLAGISLIPIFRELKRGSRYTPGYADKQMEKSALGLAVHTTVKLVILSHIHKDLEQPPYINTGSLTQPKKGFNKSFIELTLGRKKVEWKRRFLAENT